MKDGRVWIRFMLVAAFTAISLTGTSRAGENQTEAVVGFISSLSGTFAGVSETQRKAFVYAVEEKNAQGGLNMPWGKVTLNTIVADDEAKLDIGVQRFRDMLNNGAISAVGSSWNPMTTALNEEAKIDPVIYISGSHGAIDIFKKGIPAPCTFSSIFTPWTLGYLNGQSIMKTLGKTKIFYLERSDSWGQAIGEGLELACKDFGGEIVGRAQVPLGTVDFASIINQVKPSGAEVFLVSMFGGDAIACVKQAYDMGIGNDIIIYNCATTNVVAEGLPRASLENMYGIHFFYWDISDLNLPEAAKKVNSFSEGYMKRWGEPPDSFSGATYMAMEVVFNGAEQSGSLDPLVISDYLKREGVETIKGNTRFRIDQQSILEHAAFLVRGKGEAAAKGRFDYFEVMDVYGGESILPPLDYMGY